MAAALASLITGRATKSNVAMTGEITLRGQVLPVGGIKDKVLAAHRFGVDTVIIPKKNENDLDDLPADVRKQLKFVLAEHVEDVLDAALSTTCRQQKWAQEAQRRCPLQRGTNALSRSLILLGKGRRLIYLNLRLCSRFCPHPNPPP